MTPKQLSLPYKFINIESYTEIWIPSRPMFGILQIIFAQYLFNIYLVGDEVDGMNKLTLCELKCLDLYIQNNVLNVPSISCLLNF